MLLMIKVTVKGPLDVKECDGFCSVEVLLIPDNTSPKFQFQVRIGPPPFCWERSVNRTGLLAQVVDDQLKFAIGEGIWFTVCSTK